MNKIFSPGVMTVTLSTVACSRLNGIWIESMVLSGNHWRCYRNFALGAGVGSGGRRIPLRPDALYLLPPEGNLHTWCGEEPVDQLFFHFHLPGIGARRNLYEIPLTPEADALSGKLRDRKFAATPGGAAAALRIITLALTELPERALFYRGRDQAVSRSCEVMLEHLGAPLSVDTMAHWAGLAPTEYSRRFVRAVGTTPYRYLNNLRYEQAARLLLEEELGIEEVCAAVGIGDRFHFSRCFKKRFGETPAAYRRHGG